MKFRVLVAFILALTGGLSLMSASELTVSFPPGTEIYLVDAAGRKSGRAGPNGRPIAEIPGSAFILGQEYEDSDDHSPVPRLEPELSIEDQSPFWDSVVFKNSSDVNYQMMIGEEQSSRSILFQISYQPGPAENKKMSGYYMSSCVFDQSKGECEFGNLRIDQKDVLPVQFFRKW